MREAKPYIPFDAKTGECHCCRCGHIWFSKKDADGKFIRPKQCARTKTSAHKACKDKNWDKPRVYGGSYLNGARAMAIRVKPTGRAAAKLKREELPFKVGDHVAYKTFETMWFNGEKSVIERPDYEDVYLVIPEVSIDMDWQFAPRLENAVYLASAHFSWVGWTEMAAGRLIKIADSGLDINDLPKWQEDWKASHLSQISRKGEKRLQELFKEKRISAENFEVAMAFAKFEPVILKFHKQGKLSSCHDWWRSRWSEWIGYTGQETTEEWRKKKDLELMWAKVWETFKFRFTENIKF